MTTKLSLFDILSDIITHKTGTLQHQPDFETVFSSFMVLRYLFCKESTRDIALVANGFSDALTSEQMYMFLVTSVPFSSNSFIRYIK